MDCFLLAAFFYDPQWFDDQFNNAKTSVTVISAVVITLATFANLASVGSKIVLEKDWTVVVAMDDPEQLASMNAVFRTIDLTTLGRSLLFHIRNLQRSSCLKRGVQLIG